MTRSFNDTAFIATSSSSDKSGYFNVEVNSYGTVTKPQVECNGYDNNSPSYERPTGTPVPQPIPYSPENIESNKETGESDPKLTGNTIWIFVGVGFAIGAIAVSAMFVWRKFH